MIKKKLFFGLIPAKLKSLRLKKKNLLKIKNKTLLEISINSSKKSKNINETFVSTNSKKIFNLSSKLGSTSLMRLEKFSSNNAPSRHVVIDFIHQLKLKNKSNTYIVYLQPTSPLRTTNHIDKAIKTFCKTKKKSLVSFSLEDKSILKNFYVRKNKMTPIFKGAITTNSENLPNVYKPNGAIFIFSVKEFLKEGNFPFKSFYPFIMNANSSIDIDDELDFLKAKKLLAKN